MCPTRSPSQDTNRSTCRGECSWSGPLATPPGRCQLGPLANGPRRNPHYCLRSGRADTDTGGPFKPLRSGTSPASLAGPCHPGPPLFAAVLVPASPLSSPGLPPFPRPFPHSLVPAVPRPSLLSFPALSFFFVGRALASPPLAPHLPSPLAVPLLSVPLFGVGGGVGGGGGALAVCSLAYAVALRCRHVALVPLQGGGDLPCGPLRCPSYPVSAPPVVPP